MCVCSLVHRLQALHMHLTNLVERTISSTIPRSKTQNKSLMKRPKLRLRMRMSSSCGESNRVRKNCAKNCSNLLNVRVNESSNLLARLHSTESATSYDKYHKSSFRRSIITRTTQFTVGRQVQGHRLDDDIKQEPRVDVATIILDVALELWGRERERERERDQYDCCRNE